MQDNRRFCTNCGTENVDNNKFCSNCGHKLQMNEQTIKNEYEQHQYFNEESILKNKDIDKLVFKNTEYYMPKFDLMKKTNQKVSWNWSAFFFSSYWAIYRKMYLVGFGIICLDIFLNIMMPFSFLLLNLIIAIIFGLYGNYMYLTTIEKKSGNLKHLDDNLKEYVIRKHGGVNLLLALLIPFLSILVFFIMFSFLGLIFSSFLYY